MFKNNLLTEGTISISEYLRMIGFDMILEVVRVPGTDGIYVGAGCETGTGDRKKFLAYTDRSGIMRRNKFISGTKEEW